MPAVNDTYPVVAGETLTVGVPYDLYGTDTNSRGTIPFTVTWPTAPVTTQTINVPADMSLSAALAISGARINVAAGSYGTLALSQNDQQIVLDNSATFTGFTTSNRPTRVSVTGGVISVGTGTSISLIADDLRLSNISIPTVNTFSLGIGSTMCNRVAVIHCTIIANQVAMFSPGATASDAGAFGSDFIIAANYLQGGVLGASGAEPALRIMSNKRTVIVDNRARCGVDGGGIKHTYRSHYGNEDFWMRRNMSEYGDGVFFQPRANQNPILPNNYMGAHWVYDHRGYIGSNNPNANAAAGFRDHVSSTNWFEACYFDGNELYDYRETNPSGTNNTTSSTWRWSPQAGDVVGDNIRYPYQAPPALGSWLAADGLQPGADH